MLMRRDNKGLMRCFHCDRPAYQDPEGVWQCPAECNPPEPLTKATPPRDVVTEITSKRGPIYGPFLHNGIVAQSIKDAMRTLPGPDNQGSRWYTLPPDVREALDLIALKMSRILTGDPEYLDNWDDIGGYAKIVADRLRAKQPQAKG